MLITTPSRSRVQAAPKATIISGMRALTGGAIEDIWSGAATTRPRPAAAAFELVSSHANDTLAGAGVKSVRVISVVGGVIIVTDVAMDGTTPVLPNVAVDDVLAVFATAVGATGSAVGIIDVRGVGAGTVWARIAVGAIESEDATYIASGGTTALKRVDVAAGLDTTLLRVLVTRAAGGLEHTLLVGMGSIRCDCDLAVEAGDRIRVVALGTAASLVTSSLHFE